MISIQIDYNDRHSEKRIVDYYRAKISTIKEKYVQARIRTRTHMHAHINISVSSLAEIDYAISLCRWPK